MASGSGSAWGNRVRDWMCGVSWSWSYTPGQPSATVTAQCVWRSVYKAFDVDYCDAWLVCDGASAGASGIYHVVTDGSTDFTEVQISRTFSVPATVSPRDVRVAASFVMPDVQPGSSYAESTFRVPGNVSAAPAPPTVSMVRTTDYDVSWQALTDFTPGAPTETLEVETKSGAAGAWEAAYSAGVASTSPSVTGPVSAAPNGTYSVRARATNAAGSSAWSDVATVHTTPALSSLAGTYDRDAGDVLLTWAGGSQAALTRVRRSADGGSTWTLLADANEGGGFTDGAPPLGSVRYEVAPYVVNGGARLYGRTATADVATATTTDYPQVSMAPVSVHDLPWTATWTASPGVQGAPIVSQEVRLFVAGALAGSWEVAPQARTLVINALEGDGSVIVTVVDSNGLASSASAAVSVDFWPPAYPTIDVDDHGNGVKVTVGSRSGAGKADTVEMAVLCGDELVAEGLDDGDSVDCTPPLNVQMIYTAVAKARNGLVDAIEANHTLSASWGAVDMAGGSWRVELDPKLSESVERGGEEVQVEGVDVPLWYPDGTVMRSVRLSFTVLDGFRSFRAAAESADVCDVRSPHGERWHGHPSWGFDVDGAAHKVGLTLVEVVDGA